MRRLLVTGGAGFIGANFLHYWARAHERDHLVAFDALTYAGNRASITSLVDAQRVTFVHADIADGMRVRDVLTEHGIDTIVNFAAESHVDRSISGPSAFVQTNLVGTFTLLEAARSCWRDRGGQATPVRFHHVSTDEVFGSLGPGEPAFSESTRYAPNSPYAASKAGADHLVRAYAHTYGLPVTSTNCSNNYGPYQFRDKLIPLALVNALDGVAIPVYGDGMNIRDWIHVEDHCRAIELVLARGAPGEVYNVGGRDERANLEIVRLLCATLNEMFRSSDALRTRFPRCPASGGGDAAGLISFVADRPGHDRRYAIDARKIERELGFTPRQSLESGVTATVRWYLDNEDWWRPLHQARDAQ